MFTSDGSMRYIESLDSGKSSQIILSVDTDKDAMPGTYGLDLLVDFEDAQGKSLQDKVKLSLTILQKDFFRAVFIDNWFVWLAVIFILFMAIKGKMGKKKKKE